MCINMRGASLLFQRQPLLQPGLPSEVTEAESARRPPSAHNGKPCLRFTSALKCCMNTRIFFYFTLVFLPAVFVSFVRCPDAPTEKRSGKLVMRRVNVPELDQRFTDVAEIFNEQQEHHEAMLGHIRKLRQSCDSTDVDNPAFAECIGTIRKEQGEQQAIFV